MRVDIRWRTVGEDHDEAWRWTRALYAYQHPRTDELLYIGKAAGPTSSLRSRWKADDKRGFWIDLERQRGIHAHVVLVGAPSLDVATRFSSKLLLDVETLLIAAMTPWGNIMSRRTRISRPGMVVRCLGAWPGPRTIRDL